MAIAQELVSWAQSQIGTKESPANSNRVWYWDFYKEHCGVNYQGSPWCAAFVTCGMTLIGQWNFTKDEGRFRYCPSLVSWAKQQGEWLDRNAICQPGDIILFANGNVACHVGIVEKRISSSQVQTIEGNTSASSNDNGGSVMRRVRTYGNVGSSWYILGFVRPKWYKAEYVPVTIRTANHENDPSQLWYIRGEIKDGAEVAFRNKQNWLWLSDPNSSTVSGTPAQTWGGTENNADPREPQKMILHQSKNGAWAIQPKVAPNLRLDVQGGSYNSEINLQFYSANDSAAQDFFIYPYEDAYRIISAVGNKPLTVV